MNDLLDERAGLSEEEEAVSGGDGPARPPEKEADDGGDNSLNDNEEEDEDEESAEDSSEEEEGPDDYDYDDAFIAREDEEEEAEGDDDNRGRISKGGKKRRRHRELVLEEEDYELLEENTGIRRARPAGHRRIKKARETGTRGGGMKELRAELFGDELEDLEDEEVPAATPRRLTSAKSGSASAPALASRPVAPQDDFDEDEEDDWIVDDLEAEGGEGAVAAAAAARRARRRALREGVPDVDPEALEEANEIFGDVSDLLAMYEERKAATLGADQEAERGDEEEEEEDLFGENEDDGVGSDRRRRSAAARKMEKNVDPSLLERHYLTTRDEQIRDTDIPERLQLYDDPAPRGWSSQMAACAAWITTQLLDEPGVAQRLLRGGAREVEGRPPKWVGRRWSPGDLEGGLLDTQDRRGVFLGRQLNADGSALPAGQREAVQKSVEAALGEIYDRQREPETIGTQAKERVSELLVLRRSDEPYCTRVEEADDVYAPGTVQPRDRVIRRFEVLHAVQEFARRWRATERFREARRDVYEEVLAAVSITNSSSGVSGASTREEELDALVRCLELLEEATDREAIDDVDARFKQISSETETSVALRALSFNNNNNNDTSSQRQYRAAGRSGAYALLRQAGLAAALPRFAVTASALAGHLERGFVPADAQPKDPAELPIELVTAYLSPELGFGTPELALKGIVKTAAAEIAAEPGVKSLARERFWQEARVSTFPTPAGEASIDPTHPYALAKRLRGKPLHSFAGDLWVRVAAAEREGLIKVTFDATNADGADSSSSSSSTTAGGESSLLAALRSVYLTGRMAPIAREWDAIRLDILRTVVRELGPVLETGARRKLLEQARSALRFNIADAVWDLAVRAPHRFVVPGAREEEDEEVPEHERRVVAAVWGPSSPPTTLVALDASGALVDWLHCAQWSGSVPRRRGPGGVVMDSDPFQDPRRAKDAERVRAFLEMHDPHALVVGTGHPEAKGLHADLSGLLDAILVHAPGSRLASGLALVWGDERPASAWETCTLAIDELPTAQPIVRRAVALGRGLLDPLAVLTALADGDGSAHAGGSAENSSASRRAIHTLVLHPLQKELPLSARDAAVDATLTSAVAQVGIDVNALASAPWRAATLAFVPGLGPRKARALSNALARHGGHVPHRAAVWRELGVLGDVVFGAAAPSLRVRASHPALTNADMQQLDDTRIHPERYRLALDIAKLASDDRGRRGTNDDDDASSDEDEDVVALENAFARPRRVERLKLSSMLLHTSTPGASSKQDQNSEMDQNIDPVAEPVTAPVVAVDSTTDSTLLTGEEDKDDDAPPPPPPPPSPPPLPPPSALASSESDLEEDDVKRNEHAYGMATLIDIQFEFARPFGELRPKSKRLEEADLFWLCLGETPETLLPGKKVEARVRYVSSSTAFVNLPDLGNIEASIQSNQVSSSQGEVDCRDYLKQGDNVTARIIHLDPSTGQIELSTTSVALNDDVYWEEQLLKSQEQYYVPLTAQEKAAQERSRRPSKPLFTPRQIRHPCFENLSAHDTTVKLLDTSVPVGTAIFRPSHKGTRHIILSIKIPGNQVWNLDVLEGPKPMMGTAQLQLGHPLNMEIIPGKPREQYEELDEILSRFVEPVTAHFNALLKFRHWREVPWDEASEDLIGQKSSVPANQAVYCLGVEPSIPGMFYLGYVLSRNPHREYFMITHKGFHFRQKDYRTVEHMVNAFKKAPRSEARPANPSVPPGQAVPAPVRTSSNYGSAQAHISAMMHANTGFNVQPPSQTGSMYAQGGGSHTDTGFNVPPPLPSGSVYAQGGASHTGTGFNVQPPLPPGSMYAQGGGSHTDTGFNMPPSRDGAHWG